MSSPDKQQVRQWLQERQVQRTAPPSPEEIRRQLGWFLVPAPKQQDR